VNPFDAVKHRAVPLRCDARVGLERLNEELGDWKSVSEWRDRISTEVAAWNQTVEQVTAPTDTERPSDAQVLGAVNRFAAADDIVVCAAGGLPGELHKLWRTCHSRGYHVEYGYSCMGYEIAGGMGVKMAMPEREVYVLLGDGSYLMLNSEIATSVMLGYKLIIIVLDNRGFGCINRLQHGTGGAGFNNLLQDCHTTPDGAPLVDFAGHARALGAESEQVVGIDGLTEALNRARAADKTYCISLRTDPLISTEAGGNWWDVAVPEVSQRSEVNAAYAAYQDAKKRQPY
jgi:3D-(3,5/4)-trihydroxycyclohexane-1,2-dione acylhydrolase (decyclizing)